MTQHLINKRHPNIFGTKHNKFIAPYLQKDSIILIIKE